MIGTIRPIRVDHTDFFKCHKNPFIQRLCSLNRETRGLDQFLGVTSRVVRCNDSRSFYLNWFAKSPWTYVSAEKSGIWSQGVSGHVVNVHTVLVCQPDMPFISLSLSLSVLGGKSIPGPRARRGFVSFLSVLLGSLEHKHFEVSTVEVGVGLEACVSVRSRGFVSFSLPTVKVDDCLLLSNKSTSK